MFVSKGANALQRAMQGLRCRPAWLGVTHQRTSPSWTCQPEAGYHRVPADGRALGEPDPGDVAHGRRSLVGSARLLLHRVRSAVLPPHPARQAPQDDGSMMHAFCHKGKQKTLRAGFYYAILRHSLLRHSTHEFEPDRAVGAGRLAGQDAGESKHALHYSNTRYQLSAKIKPLVASTLSEVQSCSDVVDSAMTAATQDTESNRV